MTNELDMAGPSGAIMDLRPIIISAPFGNYLNVDGATRTVGSFTLHPRGGVVWRTWRVAATVRYSWRMQSWRNKLGLPNPGIESWIQHYLRQGTIHRNPDTVVSVYGWNAKEWTSLVRQVYDATPYPVELNLSCPNVDHVFPVEDVAAAVAVDPTRIIAKLAPLNWMPVAEKLWHMGVRAFHCCNTIWTPGGGLSGAVLRPYSLAAVRDLRHRFGAEITLIGGGGITHPDHVNMYASAGVNSVAVGSVILRLWPIMRLHPIQQRAACMLQQVGHEKHNVA